MSRALSALFVLALAAPAQASILGDTVTLDWGDGEAGYLVDAVVVDPGVEYASAGGDLGFPSFDLDVDVTADTVRFDFTTDHYYYTDGITREPYTMYTLTGLDPICADGSPGVVSGVTTLGTNFDPLEWQAHQVDYADDRIHILADPDGLGGDIETYIAAGTYIELEIQYSCSGGGGGGSLEADADGVEFDWGDGTTACELTSMVVPGYEWVDAGPDLCMAGPSGRLDVDVMDAGLRIDFTAEQDFGTGGIVDIPWFTLGDLEPVCPDGSIGTVSGLTSATTNMDPLEWVPGDITFGADYVQLLGDPDDGANIRTHPGDFIEVEFAFDCGLGGGPSIALGGSCPGPMTVDVTGITPGGQVAVLSSSSLGGDVVPAGACAGTPTGLSSPNFLFLLTDWDGDGELHYTPTVGSLVCGRSVQLVDMTTCTTTNVATF